MLKENELKQIEDTYPEGITLSQLMQIFETKGMHISEPTFRKYVQLGLLVRSKRVGRKGKHQGSLGLYPVSVVRRVNTIREMMAAQYTMEDIQQSFLKYQNEMDTLKQSSNSILSAFEQEVSHNPLLKPQKRNLSQTIQRTKKLAVEFIGYLEAIEQQIVSPTKRAIQTRTLRRSNALGSADLLD